MNKPSLKSLLERSEGVIPANDLDAEQLTAFVAKLRFIPTRIEFSWTGNNPTKGYISYSSENEHTSEYHFKQFRYRFKRDE